MKLTTGIALAAPLFFLSACGEEAAPEAQTAATGGEVAGDVLGGTISDDMLPLEELTSVSPPAERTATQNGEGSGSGEDEAASSAPAEPETPAAETPEAEAPVDAPAP